MIYEYVVYIMSALGFLGFFFAGFMWGSLERKREAACQSARMADAIYRLNDNVERIADTLEALREREKLTEHPNA